MLGSIDLDCEVLYTPIMTNSQSISIGHQQPCKHASSCRYRACTGPMLTASAQYRPGTGTYRHVYRIAGNRVAYARVH